MADTSHSWVQAYNAAIEETDRAQMHERVHAAESAIYIRWQELSSSPNGSTEREALHRAGEQLLRIKTDKLKWPSWRPAQTRSHMILGLKEQETTRDRDSKNKIPGGPYRASSLSAEKLAGGKITMNIAAKTNMSRAVVSAGRRLVTTDFGPICSQCLCRFPESKPPQGKSPVETRRLAKLHLEREFATHICEQCI